MVCAGESLSPGQGRNNNGLEIGCLVDAASGLLTFTANGKELGTYYQVSILYGVLQQEGGKLNPLPDALEALVQDCREKVVVTATAVIFPFV